MEYEIGNSDIEEEGFISLSSEEDNILLIF